MPLRGYGMGFIVPALMERKPNKGQREKAENGHLVLEVDEEPVEARRFLAGGETGWVAVLDAFRESQVAHTCFVQQSFPLVLQKAKFLGSRDVAHASEHV